ncbi:hypothetical protein D9M72_513950 [compost metagenome]
MGSAVRGDERRGGDHHGDDGGGRRPAGGQVRGEHPAAVDRYLCGSRPQDGGQHDAEDCPDEAGDSGFDGGDP